MYPIKQLPLLLLFWLAGAVNAQTPLWRTVSSEQGLPDPVVSCFEQLDDGRMLMGSPTGIMMQSPGSIAYLVGVHNLPSVVNPFIYRLLHKGNDIWAITRNSILRYNLNTQALTVYQSQYTALDLYEMCFTPDSSNLILVTSKYLHWINAMDTGIVITKSLNHAGRYHRISMESGRIYLAGYQHLALLQHDHIHVQHTGNWLDAIWIQEKDRWLLATDKGLGTWNNKDGYEKIPLKADWTGMENRYALKRSGPNEYWINLKQGLAKLECLSGNKWNLQHLNADDKNPFAPIGQRFNVAYRDRNGTLYLGGDNLGYSYLTLPAAHLFYLPVYQLNTRVVWSLFSDTITGYFMVGCNEGLRVGKLQSGKGFEEVKLVNDGSKERFAVSGVIALDRKWLLLLTYGKGMWLMNRRTLNLQPVSGVNSQLKDLRINFGLLCGNGNLLLCTTDGVYACNLYSTSVKAVAQVVANNMVAAKVNNRYYCGRVMSGLVELDSGFNYVGTHHPVQQNNSLNLVTLSLLDVGQGNLLTGTMGLGLYLFSTHTKQFTPIPLPGKPSNVYTMQPLGNGAYILATNNGLIYYHHQTQAAVCINKTNLLPFNDFNQNATCATNSAVYFGGEKGVLMMHKGDVSMVFNPKDALKVIYKNVVTNHLLLSAGDQNLELQTISINQPFYKSMPIRYRLGSNNTPWFTVKDAQQRISLNYLKHGTYELWLETSDDLQWIRTAPVKVLVTIEPFFYETTWFMVIMILTLLALLIWVIRLVERWRLKQRIKQLEAEQKIAAERVRISRELHDNVGSQLTYLVTGLETSGLMLDKQKTTALKDNLQELQLAAREGIQQLRQSVWALNKEEISPMELSQKFKEWLDKMIYHVGLKAHVNISIETAQSLPPLTGLNVFRIMQEVVNNVIKHADAHQLIVDFKADKNQLLIIIKDDGKGFNKLQSAAGGHGLRNMEQRAAQVGGKVSIESYPGKGTTVTLEFVLSNQPA